MNGETVILPGLDESSAGGAGDWPGRSIGLTPREAEIIALIAHGLSNEEIAERAFLSINSVKTYIRTAYRKMKVTSRSQAVLWGVGSRLQTRDLAPASILPSRGVHRPEQRRAKRRPRHGGTTSSASSRSSALVKRSGERKFCVLVEPLGEGFWIAPGQTIRLAVPGARPKVDRQRGARVSRRSRRADPGSTRRRSPEGARGSDLRSADDSATGRALLMLGARGRVVQSATTSTGARPGTGPEYE